MAKRSYVQGYVKLVIKLADYQTKHSNALSASTMSGSLKSVGTAANSNLSEAQQVHNTYQP